MNKQERPSTDTYGKFVTSSSWVMAVVSGLVMAAALIVLISKDGFGGVRPRAFAGFGIIPVGGYMLGMTMSILFAPASYLESEAGQKWMKQVGTKTIGSMRVIAGIFSVLGLAFMIVLALCLITDDFKKPLW